MSQEERDWLDWLKRARDGKMSQAEAAEKMGVSDRWVRKLLGRMKKQGDAVVVHGLRGRASNRKIAGSVQNKWVAEADLSGLSPDARRDILQALSIGLIGLGKTKVFADVDLLTREPPRVTTSAGSHIILTLQTPALLLSPEPAFRSNLLESRPLYESYEALWNELSDKSLGMIRYFQRNRLAGGEYFMRRFQRHAKRYHPYLLTTEGSTFLFRVEDAGKAKDKLETWLRRGLPISEPVLDFHELKAIPYDKLWQHCPFLPENGYGAIKLSRPGGKDA